MKENIFWRLTALGLALAVGLVLGLLYTGGGAGEDEPEASKKEAESRGKTALEYFQEQERKEAVDELATSWRLKDGKVYPYLPEKYSQPYIFTKGEWNEYRFNSGLEGSRPDYLSTEEFVVAGPGLHLSPTNPIIFILVKCQPDWRHYIGNGVFDVPDKILRAAVGKVGAIASEAFFGRKSAGKSAVGKAYFPELNEEDILVTLVSQTDNAVIAWYKNGKVMLAGEDEWH